MTINLNASVIHNVLSWSTSLPDWVRDALRRIVIHGDCTDNDIKEVFELAIKDVPGYVLPASSSVAIPLSSQHIPPAPGAEQSVNLVSISNLKNVNRLPSDQSLPFGSDKGMMVIYGNNGSGKSGYARVLKKACRARGAAQKIQPNAFEKEENKPASAVIQYRIKDVITSFNWIDAQPSDEKLSNIFVFDSLTASHYISFEDKTCFTPFGLDVPSKLVQICDNVQRMIASEIKTLEESIQKEQESWSYLDHTAIGILLSNLNHKTDREKLKKMSVFTVETRQKKRDIEVTLQSDPQKQIGQTNASISRLKIFYERLNEIYSALNPLELETVHKAIIEFNDAKRNAEIENGNKYKLSVIDGAGSAEWREMWNKAQEYSIKKAYLNRPFPYLDKGTRCVFCQQVIDEDANKRLFSFNKDINDSSQVILKQKEITLKQYKDRYNSISDIAKELSLIQADIRVYCDDEEYSAIEKEIKNITVLLEQIKTHLNNIHMLSPIDIVVDISLLEKIKGIVQKYSDRLLLEQNANNPEERKKIESIRDELLDKEWLSINIEKVITTIDNYRKIDHLQDKKAETNTKGISTFTTEITDKFVTEKFCKTFVLELERLGLKSIKTKLEKKRSTKGVTKFGLAIDGADGWTVPDIASEGEQRCIALACYLAELSQASHNSALVFDDPVSSLDYNFRYNIADRLAFESLTRQVIVFTHDAAFVHDLHTLSEKHKNILSAGYLEWNGTTPGIYKDSLPWDSKTPAQRLDCLDKEINNLLKKKEPYPTEKTKEEIREIITKLSATIERIIETVVLNDTISRYRGFIKSGCLNKVVAFNQEEHDEIMRILKFCGDYTIRHDAPSPNQSVIPTCEQVKNEIDLTRELLKKMRSCRN